MRLWIILVPFFLGLVANPAHAGFPISRTYADVKAFMAKIVADHPKTAEFFTLGDSDSGEQIVGLKIGSGPVNHVVVGTHHGNEYGATEVTKGFAESVAANPIQGQTLWVVPVLNISGFNSRNRYERGTNGKSFDPNRNYPGPCGTEGPFTLKSTAALARFIEEKNIVASATLHTYGPLVLYPWGISAKGNDLKTAYDDLFIQLGKEAAFMSGYEVGNSTEALYAADGTYEDYAFWKVGAWSMLFELGSSHSPSQSSVDEMVRTNVPGIRRMMEQAPTQRAEKHDFLGKCDTRLRGLDRHDE
jgi:carboxypeptidase T